jgi:hypothetical protein
MKAAMFSNVYRVNVFVIFVVAMVYIL